MKQEINPIFLAAAVIVVLGVTIFFFIRATSAPTPPPGSYTPGVPPWLEKKQGQPQEGVRQVPSTQQGR